MAIWLPCCFFAFACIASSPHAHITSHLIRIGHLCKKKVCKREPKEYREPEEYKPFQTGTQRACARHESASRGLNEGSCPALLSARPNGFRRKRVPMGFLGGFSGSTQFQGEIWDFLQRRATRPPRSGTRLTDRSGRPLQLQ